LFEGAGRTTNPPVTEADPTNPGSASPLSTDSLPSTRRIVLTGFMAAGKTTVGRMLSQQLTWPFYDVDAEIESATGLSVPEIFRLHGEPHFRELEHSTIREVLSRDPLILALGGGAIEDPRTRALLLGSPTIHLVNLEASLATTLARCGPGGPAARPVLADQANLEARYTARLPLYRQAHQTVRVDDVGPSAVAQAILRHLQFPTSF
jgi:shikimate kinase